MNTVFVEQTITEHGAQVGIHVLVFAKTPDMAWKSMLNKYGSERVKVGSKNPNDVFTYTFITERTTGGERIRANEPWFLLLKMFANRVMGPSTLKAISRLYDEDEYSDVME